MDIPPKHDDESSVSAPDSESGPAKKTVRRRTTKPKSGTRKSGAAATRPPEASGGPTQLELPRTPAPAPEPARAPEPAPAPAPAPAPEPPEPAPEIRVAVEAKPVERAAPAREVFTPAPGPAEAAPAGNAGDGRPGNGGDQPQGGWQDRDDRGGFWKRNKRKRGRHGGGGPWQPGGGGGSPGGGGGGGGGGSGGGGQPREQLPPQPPPPSNAPVFGDLPNPSRFADLAALGALATEISSGAGEPISLNEIYALTLFELTAYARRTGIAFEGAPNRRQLLPLILSAAAAAKRPIRDRGYIDQTDRGCFVVHEHVNYRLYPENAFLPESLVKRFGLKRGHLVEVLLQAPLAGERCPSVVRIDRVMGLDPEEISKITPFEELIPYYPLQRILLEAPEVQKDVSMRAVDILTPIGFGQRGLIVAPPRTGKTVLLQNIANSISANSPEAKLILLLIDERPEEVTDFRRHTKGEVVSSTFDETPESHVHCAEMVIEKARRLVEHGQHIVILLDSITRLARAYNALAGNQGKTMSGGLESNALQKPKRFFGSARNIEGGGSLTIIASALIDTGSRMDEIIFEEFKGTGNSELHLDRGLVERRIFPAINIDRSGTRKEELIYHPEELQRIYGLRRAMQGLGPIESMEMLITRLRKTKSNAEFLLGLSR
jgi:transcription termination factor Rho